MRNYSYIYIYIYRSGFELRPYISMTYRATNSFKDPHGGIINIKYVSLITHWKIKTFVLVDWSLKAPPPHCINNYVFSGGIKPDEKTEWLQRQRSPYQKPSYNNTPKGYLRSPSFYSIVTLQMVISPHSSAFFVVRLLSVMIRKTD